MDFSIDFSKTIKKYRKAKGWNQADFAKKIGKNPAYISLIEGGKRTPSYPLMVTICKALDVPYFLMVWDSVTEDNVPKTKRQNFGFLKVSVDNIFKEVFSR